MADVTILGAGIFGLSIAWMCQKKGARVRIIDPNGPGAGASGGIVGALAPHTPDQWNEKKAFQFKSLLMAKTFWAEVAEVSGLSPGYARHGRLQVLSDQRTLDLARLRVETAKTLWRGEATWDVIEAHEACFALQSPTGYLVHDTLSGRIHPRQACAALAAAVIAKGGVIETGGALSGRVIHAAGVAGLEELGRDLHRDAGRGVKGQGALLDFSAPDSPQVFADGVHIIPHENGGTAIGSTSELDYDDPTATDEKLDAVLARACEFFPALRGAPVIERWAGLRPRAKTKGRSPLLGAHPARDGHFIANGGFKIGLGIAPKVGEVMADLVLDGVDTIPAKFRPDTLA